MAPPPCPARTPPRAASAPASSQLSSPQRQKKLDDILAEFCDRSVHRYDTWFRLLESSLAVEDKIKDRVDDLDNFRIHNLWRDLIKQLTQQRLDLPRSFTELIFATNSSSRTPCVRNLVDARTLIDRLDRIKPPLDPKLKPQHCLRTVLEHSFQWQAPAPAQSSRPASTVASSFSANLFHGPSLGLLSLFLQVHNPLFPTSDDGDSQVPAQGSALKYYAKVLPVLQSSGFGKSRLCVQLSTIYPGMLVCLRASVSDNDNDGTKGVDQVSFPPQDGQLFEYFRDALRHVDSDSTDDNFIAHLHIMAWLALYCDTMAHYLDMLKSASGCFDRHGCRPAQYDTCWRTVVFYLALAIHSSPSSRFVQESHFDNIRSESLCPRAEKNLRPLVLSDPSHVMPARTNVFKTEPTKTTADTVDIRQARQHAPALLTFNFRTELLNHITGHACDFFESVRNTFHNAAMSNSERIIAAVVQYLRPAISALESLAPTTRDPAFAFLAFDECGSFPELLPIIRRLWFRAHPDITWILLIDTNSDLAPLAGRAARLGSRRMHDGGTHQLCRSFSAMPTDVNLTQDDLAAIRRLPLPPPNRHGKSLRDLNLLLPKFGRPLWNDALYQSHGRLQPKTIIFKLVFPASWDWSHIMGDANPDPIKLDNQNLLALASQRVRLHLTTNGGTSKIHPFLQHQIAQHLRYICYISSTSDTMVTSTPSEPALSAAAAWFFRTPELPVSRKWGLVAQALVNAREPLGVDVGAQGEQGTMLLCSMAADLVASVAYSAELRKSVLPSATADIIYTAVVAPIKLADWLKTLIGEQYTEGSWSPADDKDASAVDNDNNHGVHFDDAWSHQDAPRTSARGAHGKQRASMIETSLPEFQSWAEQTWINFKHIVVLEKEFRKEEDDPMLLPELWLRHAAAQGPSTQTGWDLLIPVYHNASSKEPPMGDELFDAQNLSYVALQVKNWSSPVPLKERNKRVGPTLKASTRPVQCVELFLELGASNGLHEYSCRRFPTQPPRQSSAAAASSRTGKGKKRALDLDCSPGDAPPQIRHHFYVRGSDSAAFPLMQQLSTSDQEFLSLLLGRFDSISDLNFEKAKNLLVRESSKQQRDAWHADELRHLGLLVRLGNLSV